MDTYQYKASNIYSEIGEDTSIQSAGPPRHTSDSLYDLRTLNLNKASSSMSIVAEQQANDLKKNLPASCSFSSIALLNAKSKALKNIRLTETIIDNHYGNSSFLTEPKSVDIKADSSAKINLISDLTIENNLSKINDAYNLHNSYEQDISTNFGSDSSKKINIHKRETNPKNNISQDINLYDHDSNTTMKSEKVELDDIIQCLPTSASNNEGQLHHTNSSNLKSKKISKGFGIFGKKNRYKKQLFFSNTTQHSFRNSGKLNKLVSKKINNNIDWSVSCLSFCKQRFNYYFKILRFF